MNQLFCYMNRLFLYFCFALLSVSLYGQNDEIPIIQPGLKSEYRIDRKGKNILTIEVLDVTYTDSTSRSCFSVWELKATLKGADLKAYLDKDIILKEGDEYVFQYRTYIKTDNKDVIWFSYTTNGFFGETKTIHFAHVPSYDPTDYWAAQERKEQLRKEEEARLARERAKADSVRYAYIEKQNMLLTPEYLANWVGASFFTKESIESDCNVMPAAYNGGYVFYDFSKCPVTMEFDDKTQVCVEISFRLFGEDGYRMKSDLIDYGYQLKSKTRGDLIAENNFQNLQTGTTSIYKLKLKNGGYSTCRITEGQAMMFTFTRTKN